MKKTYIAPSVEVTMVCVTEQLLTISGGDTGIGYGGVDTGGTLDPAERDSDMNLWDE